VRYTSTRFASPDVDFDTAFLNGLAPDGGLYIPEEIPSLPEDWHDWGYVDAVAGSLRLFGAGDVSDLVTDAAARFAHPEVAPLHTVGDSQVLELFWGPTLSFKDHALQVLGRLLGRAVAERSEPAVVLGATSGDTGSAAIEACRGNPNLRVVILFPRGKVSEFQRRQMTTVPDENVTAVAVEGNFDDCQAMVKAAFAASDGLLAINSINWARIAAQAGYYIHLGARFPDEFDVAIPTGNFGNAYSCWIAKQMGVPIGTITVANNANHMLADVISGRQGSEDGVVPTLAPAMDIAVPSNWERFRDDPVVQFVSGWSDDEDIVATIRRVSHEHHYLLDPHTATAWRAAEETRGERPQVVVATAHPAKFGEAVRLAIGVDPELPAGFDDMTDRPERVVEIGTDPSELALLIR
jgi:threonine synthase